MELSDFIKNFAEQFDETETSEFKADTKFKELDEWSSIMALNIIAMVDEEYNVTIKAVDIRGALTIQDLFNTIAAKA